ncbi:MAG: metal-dependent hydrolase [Methanotrichaceae archaeon]
MDFFTHILIGLIIGSSADGSNPNIYIASGIFMSLLPDFDFLMAPLWKRLPFTGHHGITHTLVFIIAASVLIFGAISFLFVPAESLDTRLLMVIFLAGSSHLLGDLLGTGGVPLFYPLSEKYYKLNIDLGINPLLMFFSFTGIILLSFAYLDILPFADAGSVAMLLGSIFVIYYPSRVALKIREEMAKENKGFVALPTIKPYRWKFAKRTETPEAIEIAIKTSMGVETCRIPKDRRDKIERCEDLAYTYWHPMVQGEMRFFEYPYYKTNCEDGKMEITWNSAEAGKFIEIKVICEEGCLSFCKLLRGRKTWF